MIDRKEFRSWSHRVPWAVYCFGPLTALITVNCLILFLLASLIDFYGSETADHSMLVPPWFSPVWATITNFNLFLLPLLFSWVISFLAVRQRMKLEWPIVGLVGVAVVCGLQNYHIEWSPVPNGVTNFGVGWAFLPLPGQTIPVDIGVRLLLNLTLTLTLFTLWKSWRLHRERQEKVKRNAIRTDERPGCSTDESGP
jgi:hypothetical protein